MGRYGKFMCAFVGRIILRAFLLAFALGASAFADQSRAEGTLGEAVTGGHFLFDGRLRYEHVEQDNIAEAADGLTFRARFGFKTAPYKNFTILAEGDFTRVLGLDDFNSTVNGKTQFPVIADPDSTRLNRLSLAFSGLDKTTVEVGRQRIILDDARFVGNVGFRQNEQTFDALLVRTDVVKDVSLTYAYIWQVNRIFGSRSPAGETGANSHLINASYSGLPLGTVTGYAYLIGLDDLPQASSQTYGIRLAGERGLGNGVKAVYTAGFARQKGYRNNPADFTLDFAELEGGILWHGGTAKAGWQSLEGNGSQAFGTPLATLHAFQGFADQFLTTPAQGLRDFYVILGYRRENLPLVGTASIMAWYHDFSSATGGLDLGEEVDVEVRLGPFPGHRNLTLSLKIARFYGSPVSASVEKIWFAAGLAF